MDKKAVREIERSVKSSERWSEFARDEIRAWPRTDGLGMTDRTREILDTVLSGKSVLERSR